MNYHEEDKEDKNLQMAIEWVKQRLQQEPQKNKSKQRLQRSQQAAAVVEVKRVARLAARGGARGIKGETQRRPRNLEKLTFEKLVDKFEKLKKSKDTLVENVKIAQQGIQQKGREMVKVQQNIDKFRSYLDKSVRKR